jgi:hypothetical protein
VARASVVRRFRIESALAYFLVSLGAVMFVQWQFQWSLTDAWLVIGFVSFPSVAGAIGALIAHWYSQPHTGWFEVLSVPFIVFLLAALSASLLVQVWSVAGAASWLDLSISRIAAAALGPAFVFLVLASPLLLVVGLATSLLLRRRAPSLQLAT